MKSAPTAHLGSRRGVSVLEALTALLLGLVLGTLALAALARQRQVVAALGARTETLATERTVRVILRREARAQGVEAWGVYQDSLALRAFRGFAVVCPGRPGAAELIVSSRGTRQADAAKDSAVVFTDRGEVLVRAVAQTEAGMGACPGRETEAWDRWTLSEPTAGQVILVRYFERGSYHLSGGAFRYRRGAAGRQPLTPEVLRTPESRFLQSGAGVSVHLMLVGSPLGEPLDLAIGGLGS